MNTEKYKGLNQVDDTVMIFAHKNWPKKKKKYCQNNIYNLCKHQSALITAAVRECQISPILLWVQIISKTMDSHLNYLELEVKETAT